MVLMRADLFKNGLMTGLFLQLALGPVFFFIMNLTLQRTILDGLVGVLAVTLVDFLYIGLAIFGIGKLLARKRIVTIFGIASSIILIVFGVMMILGAMRNVVISQVSSGSTDLVSSFLSVFFLTISSPMTIVFFTSLFTAKAQEFGYSKNELYAFGIAVGSATCIFMGICVLVFSLLREALPLILGQVLNLIVGSVLIGYGGARLLKIRAKRQKG